MKAALAAVAAALVIGCGAGSDQTPPEDGGVVDLDTPDLLQPPIGPAGRFDQDVMVDDVDRTYILVVPGSAVAAMANGPVPLLIALHGAGDNAQNFMTALQLDKLAARHAFVLAVPDAWAGAWIAQGASWNSQDGQPNSLRNDFHLLQKIIADTGAAYSLDSKRFFAAGLSRGATFTGTVATASNNPAAFGNEFVSPFAAYGVCAGQNAGALLWPGIDLAQSQPHRPVWIIHGDQDQVIPPSDGQQFADDLTGAGWPVTFTLVPGAPHDWLWRSPYGHTNDELWAYFLAHPLP
jgi:poly(3-hydroxybutyrate) depolymerase